MLSPRPEITPIPVTTTRRSAILGSERNRFLAAAAFHQLANTLYGIMHGADILGLVIRNIDVEFVFERKQNIDAVERVDTELLK